MDWKKILAGLKSAEVIDDPEQIATLLEGRRYKQRATIGLSLQTQIQKSDDGPTKIIKLSGTKAIGNGAPEIPQGLELEKLFRKRKLKFSEEAAKRIVPYFASDERVDAYGDIVLQNWIFDSFVKNPVLPFSHRWGDLPIGNSLKEQVVDRRDGKGEERYEGRALWLLGVFADEETNPFAETVFRLIKANMLRAGSVGFWSALVIDVKDEEEREELGLGRWGFVLDQNHLLEFSPTMLPANTGAFSLLSLAKQNGILQPEDFGPLRELYRQQIVDTDEDLDKVVANWRSFDNDLRTIGKNLFPELNLEEHEDFDVPIIEWKGTEPELEPEVIESEIIELVADTEIQEAVSRLEQKLDRLTALMEQALISQGRSIEDIRGLVESLADEAGIELETTTTEEEPDEPRGDSRVEELLRELDEARQAVGSVLS